MTGPWGTRTDTVLGYGGAWNWEFTARLSMPLGAYSFTVRQGSFAGTIVGRVDVRLAEAASVYQVAERSPAGRPGVQVELGGFGRNASVDVFLYERASSGPFSFVFLRALPRAHVGPTGEGTYAVNADPADGPGDYDVAFNPSSGGCEFCALYTVP